jgi:hypothetical protein
LAPSCFQALDEQVLDFVGRGAPGRLQQAGLDPQHLGDGPAFTGLFRNGESFLDDIQRGIAMACLAVSFGFEGEKDRQPEARARLSPGRQTFVKLLDPLVRLALACDGPAIQNSPARRPERKVVFGTNRNDSVGIGSRIVRVADSSIKPIRYLVIEVHCHRLLTDGHFSEVGRPLISAGMRG